MGVAFAVQLGSCRKQHRREIETTKQSDSLTSPVTCWVITMELKICFSNYAPRKIWSGGKKNYNDNINIQSLPGESKSLGRVQKKMHRQEQMEKELHQEFKGKLRKEKEKSCKF